MVVSRYSWKDGVELEEHTRRKLTILRQYLARYLTVRCALPQQTKFRLAIADVFAGGGRYKCGSPGSPLVIIEELRAAVEGFNLKRKTEGMASLDIECFLVLNDSDPETIEILKSNVVPVVASARSEVPQLHLQVVFFDRTFEELYPDVKTLFEQGNYRNVIFNLDQYGYSDVQISTLSDICVSFTSAECFYTFSISSLISFLDRTNPGALARQLAFLGVSIAELSSENLITKGQWLGAAERIVFDAFRVCARYVSPFSVNNPGGWRYWLIHLANSYRARQEYNNILHQNSTMQAHFGRSGLNMLAFDPKHEGALYLFDVSGRENSRQQLLEDIPRLVSNFGDAVSVGEFYGSIYNMTPAHMDEIHAAMIENLDLEVITEAGGERRKPNTIRPDDVLRMKRQRTLFPIFFGEKKNG